RPAHHQRRLHGRRHADRARHPVGIRAPGGARLGPPRPPPRALMTTMADLVRARAEDATTGLLFEEASCSYADVVQAAAERAAVLRELRRPGPFHTGVLL